MFELYCEICGKKLKGKQRKYCSVKCSKKGEYLRQREYYIKKSIEWQQKNKEKYKIKQERWKKGNLDKYREYQKEYHHQRKDHYNEYYKARQKDPKERAQWKQHWHHAYIKRRKRKLSQELIQILEYLSINHFSFF